MTTTPATVLPEQAHSAAVAAAAAAAGVLPAAEPLTAGSPAPIAPASLEGFAGVVLADLDRPGSPRIAVLVGPDLVGALSDSPLGGLDLAAAVQPALDAAASSLGTTARPARAVDLALVLSDLGGPVTGVPLAGPGGTAGALLVPDALFEEGPAPTETFTALDGAADAPVVGTVVGSTQAAVGPLGQAGSRRGMELLHGVAMDVTVELGRTQLSVRDLLALTPGTVLELDRAAGSPADLLVNGRLIARGEVVVVDEDYGLRVTEILDDTVAG